MNLKRFRLSFKAKLIASFLVAAGIPYIITLITLFGGNEQKIIENISKELVSQTKLFSEDLKKNFYYTEHDIRFLSQYEIMDDMLTGDVDKRISKLLEAKKKDMGIDGNMFCVDAAGNVIAASALEQVGAKMQPYRAMESFVDLHTSVFSKKKVFTIVIPIFASFEKSKQIGSLIFEYSSENFKNYLYSDAAKKLFLFNPKSGEMLGDSGSIKPIFKSSFGVVELNGFVMGYQKLDNTRLSDWYIVSATAKDEAMKFLNEFRFSFLLSVALGIVLIIAVSLFFAGKVIRPIKELFLATNEVIDTADYSKRVNVSSGDEIGLLSNSFNEMIARVESSMETLEMENEQRLRLFVALIGIFNKILAAGSESETLEIAKDELQKFLPEDSIEFVLVSEELESYSDNAMVYKISVLDPDGSSSATLGSIRVIHNGAFCELHREFFVSISKMISLQLERLKLFEKTQAASRAKSAFIANMSHELRTPLNSIIGFSQFLQGAGVVPEAYKEAPKNIEISGKHLLSMINEILDFAKIEAGKMTVNMEEVQLDTVLSEVVAIMQALVAHKGLGLNVEKSSGIVVIVDYGALKQILINLISNAVKFTEKGGVDIYVRVKDGQCEISVKDTGIGISLEDSQKLFSDFTQIENPMQKKHKGTGLGLSLSKKMAVLMGGDLTLRSDGIGYGCTATVTLGCR